MKRWLVGSFSRGHRHDHSVWWFSSGVGSFFEEVAVEVSAMPILMNNLHDLRDLLALVHEIAATEQLPHAEALHRALAEHPGLLTDAGADVRYRPTSRPGSHAVGRHPPAPTRWRIVAQPPEKER